MSGALGGWNFPPLYVSLCPPTTSGIFTGWAFQRQFYIGAYQASACIILAYILFTKLSVQVGGDCMCEYWVVKFIGNRLQNNNLQSASWFLMSCIFPHAKGLMSQRPLSLMNLWHLTWNWSTESSHHLNRDPSGDDLLREFFQLRDL